MRMPSQNPLSNSSPKNVTSNKAPCSNCSPARSACRDSRRSGTLRPLVRYLIIIRPQQTRAITCRSRATHITSTTARFTRSSPATLPSPLTYPHKSPVAPLARQVPVVRAGHGEDSHRRPDYIGVNPANPNCTHASGLTICQPARPPHRHVGALLPHDHTYTSLGACTDNDNNSNTDER